MSPFLQDAMKVILAMDKNTFPTQATPAPLGSGSSHLNPDLNKHYFLEISWLGPAGQLGGGRMVVCVSCGHWWHERRE